MADAPSLEEIAQELYVADPDSFVARRSELAKKFRAEGEKDLAKQVQALRKPTKSANLLNVLARDRPELVAAVLDLGAELQQAQRALDGPRLRELTGERRGLINSILRAITDLAEPAPTAGILDEVNSTVTAALADPQVATHLQAGLLVQPGEWAGFGFDIGPNLTVLPGGKSGARGKVSTTTAAGAAPKSSSTTQTAAGTAATETKKAKPAMVTEPSEAEPRSAPETAPKPRPNSGSTAGSKSERVPAAKAGPTPADLRAQRRAELETERKARLQARGSEVADRKAKQLKDAEQDLATAEQRLAATGTAVDDAQVLVDELAEQLDSARETLEKAESEQMAAQRARREAFQALQRLKRHGG